MTQQTLEYQTPAVLADRGKFARRLLITGVLSWIFIALGIVVTHANPEKPGVADGGVDPFATITIALSFLLAPIFSLISIVLGVIGVGKRRRNRRIALYGVIASVSLWLAVLFMMTIRRW